MKRAGPEGREDKPPSLFQCQPASAMVFQGFYGAVRF